MANPIYKYKDSGVEWLGKIPEHWKVKKVKRFCRILYGDNLPQEKREDGRINIYGSNGVVGSTTMSNTIGKTIIIGRKGSAGELNYSFSDCFVIDTAFYIDKDNSKCDIKWLYYALQVVELKKLDSDSPVPGLPREQVYKSLLPSNSYSEQKAIAEYLDNATAKIDRIIEIKEKQLEKIEGYKSTAIFEILLNGLNNAYEYKKMEIEWFQKIPVSWKIKRIKDVGTLQSGDNITSLDIAQNGDYPVYGGNGLRGYTLNFNHDGFYVLIGRQGALCGNINYAKGKFWASEHAVVITIINKNNPIWLGELLRAMNLNQYSNSAAQPGLAVDKIKRLKIPVPPLDEQKTIAEKIENLIKKVNTLREKITTQITILKSYRKSLIHEVVTGKKQVYHG